VSNIWKDGTGSDDPQRTDYSKSSPFPGVEGIDSHGKQIASEDLLYRGQRCTITGGDLTKRMMGNYSKAELLPQPDEDD